MTKQPHESCDREQRLQEALVACIEAAETGRAEDRDALLARYPEFAVELREFLAGRSQVERLAEPLRTEPPVSGAEAPTTGLSTSAATAPLAGARVQYFGDYELLQEIGRGGMGVVYKARQVSLKRVVALKMILTGQLADDADVRRFHAEAQAAAKLDHAGIVPVFEVGQHEGHQYFTMAFVEGRSLALQMLEGLPPPREAAALIKQVAEAVAYAHLEGVVHRDLKPANILIDKTGQPRLTDFGLAKRVNSTQSQTLPGTASREAPPRVGGARNRQAEPADMQSQAEPGTELADLTQTGQVLGTPSYMPPEQASGKRGEVGPLSDVYSLGAVLYALLTGRPPFQAATALDTLLQVLDQDPAPPRQLNRSIPRDLETICLKCLEKEPSKRYGSARALIADLERFLTGQPIQARPASRRERVVKWMRRRPAAAALMGVSAAAAVGFVALGIALLVNARHLADEATKRESAERDRGDLLRKQTELLTAQVAEGRSHAYSSDVVLAGLSLDRNDAAGAQRYLDGTRPKPAESDLRGFEWHYLWRKNNLERLNLPKTGLFAMPPPYPHRERKHAQRRQLVYSPDGKYLASTRDVCDAATGKVLFEYDDAHDSQVFFSLDSRYLFARWNIYDLTAPAKAGAKIALPADGRFVPLGFIGKQNTFAAMADWRPGAKFDEVKKHWNELPPMAPSLRLFDVAGKDAPNPVNDLGIKPGLEIGGVSLCPSRGRLAVFSAPRYQQQSDKPLAYVDVWDLMDGGRKSFEHKSSEYALEFTSVEWSPDGNTLAVIRKPSVGRPPNRHIQLCDPNTGKERLGLDAGVLSIFDVCFAANGSVVMAVSGTTAQVKAWDAVTGGELLHIDRGFYGQNLVAAVSPDGATVALSASEVPFDPAPHNVKLWDTATGKLRATLLGHRQTVRDLTFSPDGKALASIDLQRPDQVPTIGNLKLWNLRDGPDGILAAGAGREGPPIGLPVDGSRISALDMSPDAKLVAIGFESGKIQLCDAGSLKVLKAVGQDSNPAGQDRSPVPRKLPVVGLAFSPDSKRLAASHSPLSHGLAFSFNQKEASVDIWDLAEDRIVTSFDGWLAMTGAYSGNFLATNSSMPRLNVPWENHTMTIWDAASRKPRHTVKEGSLCAFTRDGRWAAIAAPIKPRMTEYRITLWNAATGAEKTLPDSFYALSTISLDFSPDGRRLVVCGFGLTIPPEGIDAAKNFWQVRLYDVAAGTGTLLSTQDRARVAFSGDSKLLAVYGGKVTLWDVATAKELATVPEELGCLHAALAADGKTLVTLNRGWWQRDGLGATGKIMPFNSSTGGAGALEKPASIAPVYEVHVWDIPSPLTPLPKGEGNASTPLPKGEGNVLKCRQRFVASWGGSMENRFDDISVNALWFGIRSAFRLSPDGQRVLTLVRPAFWSHVPAGDRLQVWDVATGKQAGDLGDGGTEFANIAYTTDGRLLAATTQRLNLHLSYERPITPEFRSTVHLGPGDYNAQFRVRLWDLTNQKELAVPDYEGCALPSQIGATNDLGRTVDYVVLLLTSPESLSRGSNTTFGSPSHKGVHAEVPRDRPFSKEVKLIERGTNKVLHVLKGHEAISRIAFSPDGKTLAVGDYGGMIRLWNVAAGRLLLTIPAHPGGTPGVAMSPVRGLAFRADGRLLVSCSASEIRLWHAAAEQASVEP